MSFHYTYVPPAPAPHPWNPKPKKVEVAKAPAQYVHGYYVMVLIHIPLTSSPSHTLAKFTSQTPPAMIYQPPTAAYYYAPQPAPEPVKTNYWYGASKAEVDKRNIEAAHATGATKPVQLVPHGTSADQQFYVKELDGSWTLRTTTDIMGSCLPGHWEYAQGGYPFFVRKKKD